jgi:hypothetical protein
MPNAIKRSKALTFQAKLLWLRLGVLLDCPRNGQQRSTEQRSDAKSLLDGHGAQLMT